MTHIAKCPCLPVTAVCPLNQVSVCCCLAQVINCICTGCEENLAELADSEMFVEFMPIIAMQCLLKHSMGMAGGVLDSAMSVRIALLMTARFPSSDSRQVVVKAFDAARSAQQLMDSLNLSLAPLVTLP